MYYLYRSHLYSTFLKPRRCSETQSQKHLLQQRQSFMEDILACFSTAGEMQEVCKGCVHKAQRQGSKIIYTKKKKKKTDTVLLSICSLAYEVFIWITMQSIPQNQVKCRIFLSFPPLCTISKASTAQLAEQGCQNRNHKAIPSAHKLLKQKRFAMCCSLFPQSHSAGRTSDKSWRKVKAISCFHHC